MKYIQYNTAVEFLNKMGAIFEGTEALNGLLFGICLQLKEDLFMFGGQPLLATVEDDGAIYIAVVMTPPFKLLLFAPVGVSAHAVETLVNGLRANRWSIPAVLAEKNLAESFSHAWTTAQNCHYRKKMDQRIHELRAVQTVEFAHGRFMQATLKDLELAIVWEQAFHLDCFGDTKSEESSSVIERKVANGELFFWADPAPVSMAVRTRPTPNGESIGHVYTPPEHRGHGYATSVVASLSQKILDDGKRFCCLYTDLANPTSNNIYRKIGYMPVADVIDIQFDY